MKNHITIEQLQALENAKNAPDYQTARKIAEQVPLTAKLVTPEEKRLALQAKSTMMNPNDFGLFGKLSEIEKRVNRTIQTNTPIAWGEYRARPMGTVDQKIKNPENGKFWQVEHKAGAGDWGKVNTTDKAQAIQEIANRKGLLCWDTEYFTILLPWGEFIQALDGYRLGAGTFFKPVKKTNGKGWTIEMQCFTSSTKKIAFLESLQSISYNLDTFLATGKLVR